MIQMMSHNVLFFFRGEGIFTLFFFPPISGDDSPNLCTNQMAVLKKRPDSISATALLILLMAFSHHTVIEALRCRVDLSPLGGSMTELMGHPLCPPTVPLLFVMPAMNGEGNMQQI